MLDRTRIGCQVWHIAKQYNITMTSVHDIINSYIAYCKGLVAKGERVELFGLVSIVPNVITSDYTTTLAFECEKVADLPKHQRPRRPAIAFRSRGKRYSMYLSLRIDAALCTG